MELNLGSFSCGSTGGREAYRMNEWRILETVELRRSAEAMRELGEAGFKVSVFSRS